MNGLNFEAPSKSSFGCPGPSQDNLLLFLLGVGDRAHSQVKVHPPPPTTLVKVPRGH